MKPILLSLAVISLLLTGCVGGGYYSDYPGYYYNGGPYYYDSGPYAYYDGGPYYYDGGPYVGFSYYDRGYYRNGYYHHYDSGYRHGTVAARGSTRIGSRAVASSNASVRTTRSGVSHSASVSSGTFRTGGGSSHINSSHHHE